MIVKFEKKSGSNNFNFKSLKILQKLKKLKMFFILIIFLIISLRQEPVESFHLTNGPYLINSLKRPVIPDNFNDPVFHSFMGLTRLINKKPYTGLRASKDSTVKASWYMNTVIVIEEDVQGKIINCEFIDTVEEVYKNKLLDQLSRLTVPKEVNLEEILKTMDQCQKVRSPLTMNFKSKIYRGQLKKVESLLLLRAIVPGTRWCGVGDIAATYHDLGFRSIDKCCRTHDFCPESLLPKRSYTNLTNPGPFTRSHCRCDEYLKQCLINNDDEDSKALGNVYFNLLKIPCIEDTEYGKTFGSAGSFPTQEQSNERNY